MDSQWPRPQRPGLFKGEAVVLWRLAKGERHLQCFVVEWTGAFWLGLECSAGELLASETLTALANVVERAEALKRSYLAEGWIEP